VTARRWLGRAVLAAFVVLAVIGGSLYERTTPDLPRVILLVFMGVAVLGLVVDFSSVPEPDWEVVTARPVVPAGLDPSLSRNVRMLENHLTARNVEPVLQRRLAILVDLQLAGRGMQRGDPGVDERLGPTLCDVIDSPPRQLSRTTLEECIRRIEELSS
jgi:hypothetical protein